MRDLVNRVYTCIGMDPYWFPSEAKVSIAMVCTSESARWSKCVEDFIWSLFMFSSHLSEYGLSPYVYSTMDDFRSFQITGELISSDLSHKR
jgi:hypothetical protein